MPQPKQDLNPINLNKQKEGNPFETFIKYNNKRAIVHITVAEYFLILSYIFLPILHTFSVLFAQMSLCTL
jgi:hypothetical protein